MKTVHMSVFVICLKRKAEFASSEFESPAAKTGTCNILTKYFPDCEKVVF